MVGGWKSERIEKILISLLFVWLRVEKWRDKKEEKKKKEKRKKEEGKRQHAVQTRPKKERKERARGNMLYRPNQKKKERSNGLYKHLHMDIFVIYLLNSSHSVFSPFWRENILVGLGCFLTKHPPKKISFPFSLQSFPSTLFHLKKTQSKVNQKSKRKIKTITGCT